MLRALTIILALAGASPVFAHSDSKFTKGPMGGHIVDAGGGKQHWELVANGGELTLYVNDADEKPVNTEGGTGSAMVLLAGKTTEIALKPAGDNKLTGSGDFAAAKGMKVIVKTSGVGGQSFQARLTPLQ